MPIVRARYVDGVLVPLEPLDLKDGCEVNLDVTPLLGGHGTEEQFRALAGAWKHAGVDAEALKRDINESKRRSATRQPK